MKADKIVIGFFVFFSTLLFVGFLIMGITFFVVSVKRIKNPECNDEEYMMFLKKGYILRFCYGCNVAADCLLNVIEITATGLGAFIVLIDSDSANWVVIMLITSFVTASIRWALNFKNNRIGYARAFRVLEFAIDEYRNSNRDDAAKKRLLKANKKAQRIIADFVE